MSFCSPRSWLEIKCCNSDSVQENLLYISSEVTQSCPTLCNPMNCSLPGSSVHGIFQSRVLEWIAIYALWSEPPGKPHIKRCVHAVINILVILLLLLQIICPNSLFYFVIIVCMFYYFQRDFFYCYHFQGLK